MGLYLKDINKNYSIIKLLKYAVVLSAILLIIDIVNLPSKYLRSYGTSLTWIVVGTGSLVLLLITLEFNFLDALRMVSINLIDGLMMITIISCLIYGSVGIIYNQLYLYKLIIIASVVTSTLITMLCRGFRLKKAISNSKEYISNVVDLKEIFYGDFEIKKDETILVNEKDVDYDLLERGNTINQLYNAIQQCNPDGRFVISLEGKWGSGKTTIINNVKRKLKESANDIVIIDEFDPWSYCDQESLFLNMFDVILRKSGLKYSTLTTKQMASSIAENIFGTQKSAKILKSLFQPTTDIDALKNRINDYLKQCGKKVVFFIDNIDRAENSNIILLFKLVGNVLDFERITYVLSFDNDRVKEIFEDRLSIDYQYLKKVVQMQIRIPEVDRDVLNRLFAGSLRNLLIAYGEDKENIQYYNSIIDFMCKQTNDIRDFKRFINSVISVPFNSGRYLNKRDLLIIEYIRLNNLALYQQIYKNSKFFVSHDKIYDKEAYSISFNTKEFFETLFSDGSNHIYINLLEEVFPYVKKYKNNQSMEYEGMRFSDSEYTDIAKNRRICSAKYFDLYFTNTENEFLYIGKEVKNFVDNINQSKDFDNRKLLFEKLLMSVHLSYHKEIFERFQLYIDDLHENVVFDIVTILFNEIDEIDNSPTLFALNARKRVEFIIEKLLQRVSNSDYDLFLEGIGKKYGKIENISSILYWFEHDKGGKSINGRKEKLDVLYQEMGNMIIHNTISLYDNKNYYPKNIWGLYRLYKDDESKVKDYIKKVINEKNIFRLLYDIMGLSISTKYTYSISKTNMNCLTTEEEIDEILKSTVPTSRDQQFILDVYNKYKSGITDDWGESGIVTDEAHNLYP